MQAGGCHAGGKVALLHDCCVHADYYMEEDMAAA